MEGPPNPISWFEIKGDPLQDEAWTEHELKRVKIPINAQPIDLDQDGDLDIMGGSRGQREIFWFENLGTDALGRLAWFEHPGDLQPWQWHDISRRKRGMFDKFIARDMDKDGNMDFVAIHGNSVPYDRVFWLEQIRTKTAVASFERARKVDSEEMSYPK